MKKIFFFVLTSAIWTFAIPSFAGLSAYRAPNEDYRSHFLSKSSSSLDFKRSTLPPEQIAQWSSYEDLLSFFQKTRNMRYLPDESHFDRRISWLYPDDGCYARAALVIQQAQELRLPLPNRVFLYGNLSVKTPNAPNNNVTWWYHTAPVVRIKKQIYVLDAAIDPLKPLLLDDWVGAQVRAGARKDISFCTPYTYDPNDSCLQASQDPGALAQKDIQDFLDLEWERQVDLGRDPYKVLADEPPWNQNWKIFLSRIFFETNFHTAK